MSCLQYKHIIVDKNQSIPYFPPHYGIQCSISSKVCPLRKRLPLSCHKNSSQIFDATKLWKHTIPLTYNTKTLISNISETHRFSPQTRLVAYPDHKTTLHKTRQCDSVTDLPFDQMEPSCSMQTRSGNPVRTPKSERDFPDF